MWHKDHKNKTLKLKDPGTAILHYSKYTWVFFVFPAAQPDQKKKWLWLFHQSQSLLLRIYLLLLSLVIFSASKDFIFSATPLIVH